MRDESFRKTLGLHCHSCIGFDHQSKYGDDDFVVNMKRAIVCVENVADGSTNADELKRTKFQLCAIADLNSDDFKYGFTCGIPNSCLAACAHLYLGILAKIQRKDKAAVKHILQVFSSAPFQARSLLLSELWEYLFLPHLLYLRVWYSQEVDFVDNDSNGSGKIKFIDKVYNKLLDNGTYQLAVYYREWLSDRAEAPAILSVGIPFGLAYGNLNQESHDTSTAEEQLRINGACSLQPTITKGLFDAVFGYSSKTNFSDEVIHGNGKCSFDSCTRSFSCIIDRNDQADNQSQVVLDGGGQVTLKESLNVPAKQLPAADESWELPKAVSAASKELMENQNVQDGDAVSEKALLLPVSHGLSSDLALKKLAETAFKLDMSETFNCSLSEMDVMMNNLVAEGDGTSRAIRKGSTSRTMESLYKSVELNRAGFLSSMPKDFVCPLTAQLFDEPVTLETGHTFERHAIAEWFEQGNKRCPVTGRILHSLAVPSTNFILKHMIELWKAKNWKHPLACCNEPSKDMIKHVGCSDESALTLLDQLVSGPNAQENEDNIKHLISLGGLEYLIQRFEVGNLEEKVMVVSLFISCIKADGSCRNHIAAKVNKACLLELLHANRSHFRKEMVFLLIELICLNRRVAVTNFLDGLQREGAINLMHLLLVYLQNSPLEQRPLVATLLLHLLVLKQHKSCSIYMEEALDAMMEACDRSLTDVKVRVQTCRSFLVLEGLFSCGGEALTEAWLLRIAGFKYYLTDPLQADKNKMLREVDLLQEQEEKARQGWLLGLGSMFVHNGKKLLWECFSKCLASGVPELVKASLIFLTWLSCAFPLLSGAQMKLSILSILAPSLKECLLNNDQMACRALASLSLLNFMDDSQCRQFLMSSAGEISESLNSISEVTETGRKLHVVLSSEIM
ncbi:putative E3 ubiquitin-protein ligase LIN-1 [Nymphaea colorata]|uniref:putative E3 ubiquitin-protein ligase LIN-1 n=1 Tax=Nymphaea colorata TaxID=210225 RepID=UPI00129D98F6|nr:putative E3 ubiquitin-protein ligase LIN-1 [Nymphaea colorata]